MFILFQSLPFERILGNVPLTHVVFNTLRCSDRVTSLLKTILTPLIEDHSAPTD